jgi:predicted GIY-YIG superfamily endonuclease
MEKSVIEGLPNNERQRIFDESKKAWYVHYADFKRISDVMENYKRNDLLIEFGKHTPPKFIQESAIIVYKKCISFKIKFTKKMISHLNQNPNKLLVHYFPHSSAFCIKTDKVKDFLKEYQEWNLKLCNLWNRIYSLKDEFYSFYTYKNWKFDIKHSGVLKEKADKIQKIQDDALSLLNAGEKIVLKHDEMITLEYETNATGMSLYEREIEILQINEDESAADEEYCYVYTLECDLFVFYVGIAANPQERFEQHIQGAFSDEAHLFKSKFIQKYRNQVKQKVIFEGKRIECKQIEKEYIAEFRPLGNMTEGGEG